MKSLFLTLFLSQFILFAAAAQGYEYDSTEARVVVSRGKGNNHKIPIAFSLRSYCPPPQHQGNFMTCVSWATGYAAYTILCGVANNQKVPAYSGIFLAHHLHRETNYDKGMSISKALDTLKKYGTVADAFYTHDMKAKPKSNQVVEAATHKISHYDKIFDHQKEDKSLLVEKLKQAIEQRRPIIIGFEIDDAFADDKVVLWKGFSTLNAKKYNHAVCVIGYDNSKDNGKGAFEIMNSWGDKWSDKGFGWISYEAMTKHCLAAFIMKQ